MGLNAAVFTNVHTLENRFGQGLFDVDETTGQAAPKRGVGAEIPHSTYLATNVRLGNVAEVAALRSAVEKILPMPGSVITERVLYSGSHSGDSIGLDLLPQLRNEIVVLKARGLPAVRAFADAMASLVAAAEEQRNPIVFM